MFRKTRQTLSAVVIAGSLLVGCGESTSPEPTGPVGVPEVQAIDYSDKTSTAAAGDLATAAREYVLAAPELTTRGGDWAVRATIKSKGSTHVRMQQLHEGVRVWGGDIVTQVANGQFRSVKGNMVKNLEGFNVKPTFEQSLAMRVAKGQYASGVKHASAKLDYSRESSELVIFPMAGRDAKLAWHVTFFTELQAGQAPGLWNYFIDAQSGEILAKYNAIHTVLEQGSGPGGNAKVARTWNMQLDVEPDGANYKMDTARLRTTDMMNSTTGSGTVVSGPLTAVGDAPENDGHGFAEQVLNMYQEWYGQNSIDNAGFIIKSRIHYGSNYENAFWDGTQMTYGDGATTFHPLSGAIDVVAHEVSHGYTTFHSNLTYSGESGGMNESFSDIAGTIAEFYSEGAAADFDLGEDIFKAANQALRYMCNPTADGVSIDHYSNYAGQGVHFSSGIQNKAFCRAAKRFASGSPDGTATQASVRRVGEAFFLANATKWTASSTFQQGCQGVLDAATDLNFTAAEKTALRASFVDVGVYCDGEVEPLICDTTLTAESGTVTSPNFPQPYANSYSHTTCIIPASGTPATLHFTDFNTEAGYDFVTLKDGMGTVFSRTSGTTAPADVTSTVIAIKFTTDSSVVRPGWRATWSTGTTTNQLPTVSITAPTNGAEVEDTVIVAATAADADGTVAKVTFTLPDGTTVEDTTAPYTATWDSNTVADGVYTITAIATDNLGAASAPASVSVEVSNAIECVDDTFSATNLPVAIPDNFPGGLTSSISIGAPGTVGTLSLSLNIQHTWRGDLRVILSSPTGQQYTVHDRSGGSADNLVLTNLEIPAFVGASVAGPWTLKVIDTAGGDTGTIVSWSLTLVGNCAPSGDWSGKAEPNVNLVDNGSVCTNLTISGQTGDAASTKLDIDGTHTWRSALRATLTHNGVTVPAFPVLTLPANTGTFSLHDRPVPGLSGDVNGLWTLCVIDSDAFNDVGILASWSVHD